MWRRIRAAVLGRLRSGRVARLLQEIVREPYIYGPRDRVKLGQGVRLTNATLNTQGGTITMGDYAFCGHNVAILTGAHDITATGEARQQSCLSGRDIDIGGGVWIASNAVILGPCRIGRNAVIAAGAIVTSDVAPGTIVAGVPARPIREIR